ncbi:prepilin-type N-terminal cleavage/methylation domain-containing protein [Candidatus Saccharibacteria bacterium]|nr:prepilin-type N-terminal cleavage/methylation domain-containing protein [Candidatus Saccharibacteria bacterium]
MKRIRAKRRDGFTVVEIAVVIVVMAILTVFVAWGSQEASRRAKAADVVTSFRTAEGAFLNWHVKQSWSTWQTENQLGFPNATYPSLTDNIRFDYLLSGAGAPSTLDLRNFLNMNELPARSIGQMRYDNDADSNTDPCTDVDGGVNLQISNAKEYFAYIDATVDKGDGQCGKVAQCSAAFSCVVYRLGTQSSDFRAN